MSSPAQKVKTVYEKWMELSDIVVGEIIAGELYVNPRPAPKHARATTKITTSISGSFDQVDGSGPGGWIILFEPELHIDNHIVVPDVAGWRRERMPNLPEEAFFSLIPDWICEVLSPGTSHLDRVKKMPLYLELGLKYLWLADPIEKTLEIYENERGSWKLIRTHAHGEKIRAIPFDAIEIDLAYLWS